MKKLLILIALLFSFSTLAQKRDLLVFASDRGGYPAPAMCFFSNSKLITHQDGLVVAYTCLGRPELYAQMWFINADTQIKLFETSPGNLLSDAISDGKKISAFEFSEMGTYALWQHDLTSAQMSPCPWKYTYVAAHALQGEKLLFRTTDADRNYGNGYWLKGSWVQENTPGVSFHFSPASNTQMIVQKVRLGEAGMTDENQPDVIQVRLAPEYKTVVVVKDIDADPNSPYTFFTNYMSIQGSRWINVAITKLGHVALIGETTSFKEIPLYPHFKKVDSFPPVLSASGKLILRGQSHDGRYGLWIQTEQGFDLILKSGDPIVVGNEVTQVSKTLFYTAPMAFGEDVYVGVGITDEHGEDIGQGVIKLSEL